MRLLRTGLAVALALAPLAVAAPSQAATTGSAVTVSTTLTRAHLNADGTETVADQRTVTLTVEQTKDLHSRQPVRVSWKGAHPTGSLVTDPTSSLARVEEYPMVLLECRGTAATITPQSCWTQSTPERFAADYNTGFPAWRVDRRADKADRHAVVGAPSPRPAKCGRPNLAEHWLPFASVNGTSYNASNVFGCGTQAPESSNVGAGQPSNTTYAVTAADGTGTTKFTTWTSEDNASLGCGPSVPCSLVAVPVMGISCDETAAGQDAADRPKPDVLDDVKADCRSKGNYAVGAPNQNAGGNAESVSGSLWWAASNWGGRITVPLGFAPLANACDITGGASGVDVYGSELLVQATSQWRPRFCLTKGVTAFKHVQVGEPQAKSLLTQGTIGAGFVSTAPDGGFGRPVVLAPTAVTGFSISYAIDDAKHEEYDDLKLTPRLLAKLLTESYPAVNAVKNEYDALSKNPLDMTQDPEFKALNPGVGDVSVGATAAELYSLSSDSDVIRALTSYLDADTDARAWLDGTPDPYGMVVNPSYKGITLPVESWPQRDAFEPKKFYASGNNECLQYNPVPYLPLVSAPTARLASISLGLQFAITNSQINCQPVPGLDNGVGAKLVSPGRQAPGSRFLIGVTSLGDAARYQLDSAALQVKAGVFARPTSSALEAAAALLKPDTTSGTWRLDLTKAGTATPYPGTMLVSTAVRTAGLKPDEAAAYADFLTFVAGEGQVTGLGTGQLPPGYLPLTAANGLGDLARYTVRAAAAVRAQSGTVPALVEAPVVATPTTSAPTPPPDTGTTGGTAVVPTTSVSAPSAAPLPAPSLAGPVPSPVPSAVLASGVTPTAASKVAASLLPALVGLAVVGGLVALVVGRLGRRA